jgi:hypothetical protein
MGVVRERTTIIEIKVDRTVGITEIIIKGTIEIVEIAVSVILAKTEEITPVKTGATAAMIEDNNPQGINRIKETHGNLVKDQDNIIIKITEETITQGITIINKIATIANQTDMITTIDPITATIITIGITTIKDITRDMMGKGIIKVKVMGIIKGKGTTIIIDMSSQKTIKDITEMEIKITKIINGANTTDHTAIIMIDSNHTTATNLNMVIHFHSNHMYSNKKKTTIILKQIRNSEWAIK